MCEKFVHFRFFFAITTLLRLLLLLDKWVILLVEIFFHQTNKKHWKMKKILEIFTVFFLDKLLMISHYRTSKIILNKKVQSPKKSEIFEKINNCESFFFLIFNFYIDSLRKPNSQKLFWIKNYWIFIYKKSLN